MELTKFPRFKSDLLPEPERTPCTLCGKTFKHKRSERRHRVLFHTDSSTITVKNDDDSKAPRIPCIHCDKTFKNRRCERRHSREVHNDSRLNNSIKCCEYSCDEAFHTLNDFRNHLQRVHGFENMHEKEVLTFQTREEFNTWLNSEESRTNTHFVLRGGKIKTKYFSKLYFICNRSGEHKPSSKGKRQIKAQGSLKIGFHCTADIVLRLFEDKVQAVYHKTHYKHDFLLGYIPLPTSTKQFIAKKLVQGLSSDTILSEIKKEIESGETGHQRHHLLTRKDIWNIKRSFGIENLITESPNSQIKISFSEWMEELKRKEGSILCYKEEQTFHTHLKYEDFFFAFMTLPQKQIVQDFSFDGACVDIINGPSIYWFHLIVVIIFNENEEGFPIAFCITSSIHPATIKYFFQCIKNVAHLQTSVFMSDDSSGYYQAWEEIFSPVANQLICTWNLNKDFQKCLGRISKEKREEITKDFKHLVYELNVDQFHRKLEAFLTMLDNDAETKTFYYYFNYCYCSKVAKWAYCFRKGYKQDSVLHIERIHEELKRAMGKNKELGKLCEQLKMYVCKKKVDLLMQVHKGQLVQNNKQSLSLHDKGRILQDFCVKVSENAWTLELSPFETSHNVNKMHNCEKLKCHPACHLCHICVSSYTCTCYNFSAQRYICKHIHAVNIFEMNNLSK